MKSTIAQNWRCSIVVKFVVVISATLVLPLSSRSGVFAGNGAWKLDLAGSHSIVTNRPSDDPIFSDVTQSAGLSGTGYPFGNVIWGDFDNDGDIDLFVDNHFYAAPYLYLNNGNGTFTNILATSGMAAKGDKHGSGWADFDNDGDLDLSITHGARGGQGFGRKQDELYLDLGGAQFTNISVSAGVTNTFGRGRSVAWGDYNNDGYNDLLLGNLRTDLALLKNNGDATFTDVTAQAGLAHLQYIECAFADYNNDGFPDIFSTCAQSNAASKDILLRNKGDGTFTNVTRQAGIARSHPRPFDCLGGL